ncbi:unnamed protein product [Brachionus calyciflorus]|uniref:Uncharacterized protein n=1 Tax=Brachionus calyciflorus TaxID=104777 RepID=A0A814K098_9BILA|nr:unnamed protein product [Brachionus calyciflorus]
MLFKCTHVACFAHIIALVGETWRSNLSEVDLIVANLKSIFARGSNRKIRFIDFLKSNGKENPSYYPSPVVTRWNTWFKAVSELKKQFEFDASKCDRFKFTLLKFEDCEIKTTETLIGDDDEKVEEKYGSYIYYPFDSIDEDDKPEVSS